MPNISRVNHPNDLALGLLTLLAGFGQGFAGGRIQRTENQKAEKEKQLARQDKEKEREYQMRRDLSLAGERMIDRSIAQEQFTETSAQNQQRIDIEQQRAQEDKIAHGRQFIKDIEDNIFKEKTLKEEQRYHNMWAAIENAKVALDKQRLEGGGTGTGKGKGKDELPLSKEQFALGVLKDLFKEDIGFSALKDPKKRDEVFNAIDAAYTRFMQQTNSDPGLLDKVFPKVTTSSKSYKMDKEDILSSRKPVVSEPSSNSTIPGTFPSARPVPQLGNIPEPARTIPQLNAMPGVPVQTQSNVQSNLDFNLVAPFIPDTTGFRGDIGGAPVPQMQSYSPMPNNIPQMQNFNPVDVSTVLQGLLAGYKRKFARPVSFEPMRTVK